LRRRCQRRGFHHDEDAEDYINGVLALKAGGYITSYDAFQLTPWKAQPSGDVPQNLEARVGIERIPLPQATRNQLPMTSLMY
jgi:hypothetical protein